ncbi:MAG: hypothetical protein BGO26_03210 [Actinobacteria bacterium 69-20]|nr:MAG: hypothetical protein BGO26_03210 [Actinobacteria bacterium 69-20]
MDLKDKYNLQVSVVDNLTDSSAMNDALSNLAEANQIVIGGGSALVPPANSLAANYPDTTFVMSGKVQDGIPNLHAYNMLQGVPAYVAGVVAAKVSKAGKIGFIGGATIPSTSQSDIDFEAGAKSVNPNIGYSHVTVGSFSDAAKGQQAAMAQIADGVDVIYAFLDAGLPGVIKAIDESGKDVKLFNPTTDRCDESPHIIGYDMQNLKAMVADIFRDYTSNKLPAGTTSIAIEDKDVQWWTMCPNAKEWQATADGVADQINAGKIKMPEGGM